MLQSFLKLQLLVFLLLSCTTKGPESSYQQQGDAPPLNAGAQLNTAAQLTEDQYVRLTRGVFEVVLPRIEDKDVVYQEKLPEHLLPYKLRKSPYRGIGTAFAIGPNQFVSAAHVFDLHQPSLVEPTALRDTDGKVYVIDNILKYSQHRDLVEFSLKSPPKNIQALKIADKPRMGQYVFTVGNALGDGIVTRSGYITSFTAEPVDGEWDDIRYSAPASPGNSGGPLLTKDLEVLGVVVRRTENENLNFGIPITELKKVKGAQFYVRDIKIEQYGKQLTRDWRYTVKLPEKAKTITSLVSKNYQQFQEKIYDDFRKKFKKDVFPTDPALKVWARDSLSISLAGFIQKDKSDRWVTLPMSWDVFKINKYRSIVTEKGAERANTAFFMLERPLNQKLKSFYQDGKGILDTFLKHKGWARNYMGRRIVIKSYGAPEDSFKWKDSYGRKWLGWEWNTAYNNSTIQLNCMPMPAGVFCIFNADPYSIREQSRVSSRRALDRFLIDIYGKVRDWKEWVSLPDEFKQPMIPKNVLVELDMGKGSVLRWRVGKYSGKINRKEFDLDAEVALSFIASPENIFKLRLRNVQVAEKNGDMQMGMGTNYRPDDKGDPSYREVWDKMLEGRAPYNGKPQPQDKHSLIVSMLGNSKKAKAEELSFLTCGVLSSVGSKQIEEICDSYAKSAKVSGL
ncbi:MAG: serine protease [Bdellovibrionota bacterium]